MTIESPVGLSLKRAIALSLAKVVAFHLAFGFSIVSWRRRAFGSPASWLPGLAWLRFNEGCASRGRGRGALAHDRQA
jgi:hypothetical protein